MELAFSELKLEAETELDTVSDQAALETFRVKYLGRKGGRISNLMRQVGTAPKEERPRLGQLANRIKVEIEELFAGKRDELLAAATSPEYFRVANAVATSWFGDLVFTGSAWAMWYHYLAGLRHLYFDAGKGLDVPTAEKLGWACIIGSVVLTVITIILV